MNESQGLYSKASMPGNNFPKITCTSKPVRGLKPCYCSFLSVLRELPLIRLR